jgi:hypothetical protein
VFLLLIKEKEDEEEKKSILILIGGCHAFYIGSNIRYNIYINIFYWAGYS